MFCYIVTRQNNSKELFYTEGLFPRGIKVFTSEIDVIKWLSIEKLDIKKKYNKEYSSNVEYTEKDLKKMIKNQSLIIYLSCIADEDIILKIRKVEVADNMREIYIHYEENGGILINDCDFLNDFRWSTKCSKVLQWYRKSARKATSSGNFIPVYNAKDIKKFKSGYLNDIGMILFKDEEENWDCYYENIVTRIPINI